MSIASEAPIETAPSVGTARWSIDSSYRPEIDGLRALAVVFVLLFHADIPSVAGGYIGVDIFFVISGYLITRNILHALGKGTFTFADFYTRRVRRLWPALFAVLAITLGVGTFVLTPDHLAQLGQSTVFAALSLSNVLFWLQSGYFDVTAWFKPLLHTWSLGVEEQFYLIWPAALVLLFRNARRWIIPVVAFAGVASLLAAEARFGAHSSEVFFLLPYRVFQFALGAACLVMHRSFARLPKPLADGAGLVALAALLWSPFVIDGASRIPGIVALIPCGAAAIVIAGGGGRIAGPLLGLRPVIAVGLMSYSLYLVHWPVIVYYRYGKVDWTVMDQVTVLVLSALLGYALYRLVEKPFRYPNSDRAGGGSRRFLLAMGCVTLAVVVAGTLTWASRGWPERLGTDVGDVVAGLPEMRSHMFDLSEASATAPFPVPGLTNVVLLGDSHAANLLNGLVAAGSTANYRHIHIQHMCQLFFGPRRHGDELPIKSEEEAERCQRQADGLRDNQDLAAAEIILVSSTWTDDGLDGFGELLDYLDDTYQAEITVVGPRYFFADPERILQESESLDDADTLFDAAKGREKFLEQSGRLAAIVEGRGVHFIDVQPFVCRQQDSQDFCPLFNEEREILYFDWHHWSPAGELRVGLGIEETGSLPALFRP